MNYTTWIEINKTALYQNIAQYRAWLPKNTAIAPVVKGNAYGHGIAEIGKLLEKNEHIQRLCVATSKEGVELRKAGVTKPILVLSYINTPIESIVEYNLDCVGANIQTIQELQDVARIFNKIINIHVKVDTGLSRLGFLPKDVHIALDTIKHMPNLKLQGIWSHLIESFNPKLIHQQENILKQFWQPDLEVHITNSQSSLLAQYDRYNFARIGSGIYGYLPDLDFNLQKKLHPVISLKTKIIDLKEVPAGSNVGYGKTNYITSKPTKIATLGMGYYEGVDQELLKHKNVLIHGEFAPIIGRVNMNCITVDVTHISQTKIGDTATILGQDQNKSITAYDWRNESKKNVRTFLTMINADLPKIIVEEPVITLTEHN